MLLVLLLRCLLSLVSMQLMAPVKRSLDLVPRLLLATVVVGTKAVIITGRIAKATVAVAGKVVTTMAAVGRRSLGRIMVKAVAVVVGRIITAVGVVGKTVMVAVTAATGTRAAIMEAVGTKVETTLVATAVAV